MDLQSPETWILLASVAVFTLSAAVTDFRTRRIPNWLNLTAFGLGLCFQAWRDGWAGLGSAALAFSLGFGMFLVLWLIGGGGGGDVKLMGALSVWLGVSLIWQVVIYSTILVAIHSAFVSATKKDETKKVASPPVPVSDAPGNGMPPNDGRIRVPFAVPVALATWIAIGLTLSGIQSPLAML